MNKVPKKVLQTKLIRDLNKKELKEFSRMFNDIRWQLKVLRDGWPDLYPLNGKAIEVIAYNLALTLN